MPQAIWLRCFGTIMNQAPYTSRTAPSCTPPSEASSEPSTTSTHLPTVKKQSPPGSYVPCTPPPAPTSHSFATVLQPLLPTS
jgi:hypothetical protein